jgi:DNA invertase Pin-like site-specific DNA recombinase
MDPIQEAIEDIESREDGASFSYPEVARKFNINRTTLSRRHQGLTRSNAAMAEAQQ